MSPTRKITRWVKHTVEFLLALPFIGLFFVIPFKARCFLLNTLASAWFALDRAHRNIAIANILKAKITDKCDEAVRIARESFRHFAIIIAEALQAKQVMTKDNWRNFVTLEIDPATMAALEDPQKGIILLSGHIGNWEAAAHIMSLIKPTVGVTRNVKNPFFNKLMHNFKPSKAFRTTPKHDANISRMLSFIKDGEILALLVDQHAMDSGIIVNFFGHKASAHTSPALLHLVTKAPICFGYCIRVAPMHFLLKADPLINFPPTGNREADVRTIVEDISKRLEKVIAKYPEQYLWAHRRWRNQEQI